MVTVIDFVTELLTSVVELAFAFVFDVFLAVDPISALAVVLGAAFVVVPSLVFGYIVLGAAVNAVTGLGSSAPDASPRRRA